MSPLKKKNRVCFSDIDGTIMHEPREQEQDGEFLVTPPSASGRVGVISAATIEKVAKLRATGVKFVIITGARLSTLLMRLAYMPAGDAYVCENGGRIFYPGSHLPTACPVHEDETWRTMQEAAGPADQHTVPPLERKGLLWEWHSKLRADGWTTDANGYTTSFRVHAKNGKSVDDLHAVIKTAPTGLSCTWNLGAADFYPSTSGKVEAAKYLMKTWGIEYENSAFLCDDDNDMELAAVVGRAFLPSVSSESVERAIAARPQQFVAAKASGTKASEEMVDAVAEYFGVAA